ncbi:hypothetical protein HCN44_005363 [Aphidius gifuensis]|uniref:Uncharacterized protein n=2 Tax=Aphidius gifuensis TaxID=684658 RepID=A0A834Y300_APHGI|nr:hypothetical protein HCN44_005363 [Aphidius gifuensis]
MIGYWTYHRLFVTTIDVQLGSQRWEMTSDSEFFDLRYPRSLKMFKRDKIEPAIGLDNRYRLMRGERMLDAKGNITNDYGDPPGVNSLEELAQQSQKKYALSK